MLDKRTSKARPYIFVCHIFRRGDLRSSELAPLRLRMHILALGENVERQPLRRFAYFYNAKAYQYSPID